MYLLGLSLIREGGNGIDVAATQAVEAVATDNMIIYHRVARRIPSRMQHDVQVALWTALAELLEAV